MVFDDLLFRRQFVMTSDKCSSLEHWQHNKLGRFNIYAHNDLELTIVDADLEKPAMALLGYMIDPDYPERTNINILHDLQNTTESLEAICNEMHDKSGRFVLIIDYPTDTVVLHDACGLRSVFYTKRSDNFFVGSEPLIFKYFISLRERAESSDYAESDHKRTNIEHWIPSGCSLFDEVFHLMPNHYLQLSTLSQIRYWPYRELQYLALEDGTAQASELLCNIMKAGNARFPLALTLTGGLDSRTLLAASKSISQDVYFYTLQFRSLTPHSSDIAVPAKLLRSLGYEHHIVDCTRVVDPEFDRVYSLNTPMAHNNDWGKIAYGMFVGGYPFGRVAVKGSCSEICRCIQYRTGSHQPITSPDQIVDLERGWGEIPLVRDQIAKWYKEAKPVCEASRVDILDLFYWEHRMGSWQAQNQLEWDIVHETYTPFNHRRLLETMLGTPTKYRCSPTFRLYLNMCEVLWPRVLDEPINPSDSIVGWLKNIIYRVGLDTIPRNIYLRFARMGGRLPVKKRGTNKF